MIDLINIDAHGPQILREIVENRAGPGEPLVVIAGFLEIVRAVEGLKRAAGIAVQQHELRLDAREQRVAALRIAFQLALQRNSRAVRIRFAVHITIARHAGESGHPVDLGDRAGIAYAHEVGSVRAHAQAPHGEAGESRAIADHHVVVLDRHGFRLGRAVHVDELRENVTDVVLREETLCLIRVHGRSHVVSPPSSVAMAAS